MKIEWYKIFFQLFGMAILAYLVHKWAFFYFKINTSVFSLSLEKLYVVFGLFAVFFCLMLLWVKNKIFNQVGMVFLWITSLKFVVALWFSKQLFSQKEVNISFEKNNFLIVFLVFLAIETIVSIQLVSKKENKN